MYACTRVAGGDDLTDRKLQRLLSDQDSNAVFKTKFSALKKAVFSTVYLHNTSTIQAQRPFPNEGLMSIHQRQKLAA
jgi:hypothetical protein